MNNTSTTAMMVPIVGAILDELRTVNKLINIICGKISLRFYFKKVNYFFNAFTENVGNLRQTDKWPYREWGTF